MSDFDRAAEDSWEASMSEHLAMINAYLPKGFERSQAVQATEAGMQEFLERVLVEYVRFVPFEVAKKEHENDPDFFEFYLEDYELLQRLGAIPAPKALKKRTPRQSLQFLAEELGKSPRQIRRYCEDGLIPGAYRTPGGHWRVPLSPESLATIKQALHSVKIAHKDFYQSWKKAQEEQVCLSWDEIDELQVQMRERHGKVGDYYFAAQRVIEQGLRPWPEMLIRLGVSPEIAARLCEGRQEVTALKLAEAGVDAKTLLAVNQHLKPTAFALDDFLGNPRRTIYAKGGRRALRWAQEQWAMRWGEGLRATWQSADADTACEDKFSANSAEFVYESEKAGDGIDD